MMEDPTASQDSKQMISGPVALFALANEMGCDASVIKDAMRVVGGDEGRVRAWLAGYLKANNKKRT